MVTSLAMATGYVLGSDTAATCWLCDGSAGELCHVHDPEFVRMRLEREAEHDELGPTVLDAVEERHGE